MEEFYNPINRSLGVSWDPLEEYRRQVSLARLAALREEMRRRNVPIPPIRVKEDPLAKKDKDDLRKDRQDAKTNFSREMADKARERARNVEDMEEEDRERERDHSEFTFKAEPSGSVPPARVKKEEPPSKRDKDEMRKNRQSFQTKFGKDRAAAARERAREEAFDDEPLIDGYFYDVDGNSVFRQTPADNYVYERYLKKKW